MLWFTAYALGLLTLRLITHTGPFPAELFVLAQTLESLDLSNCLFVGILPTRIGELTSLTKFLATGNDFHGPLPKEIGQLSSLEELGEYMMTACEQLGKVTLFLMLFWFF